MHHPLHPPPQQEEQEQDQPLHPPPEQEEQEQDQSLIPHPSLSRGVPLLPSHPMGGAGDKEQEEGVD